MATWKDVRTIALGLSDTTEGVSRGWAQWRVGGNLFVWERPLLRPDLVALGNDAPAGPLLGARIEHEGLKAVLIDEDPEVFFTIPHFDGCAAILIVLEKIGRARLRKVITDAWLLRQKKPRKAGVAPRKRRAAAPKRRATR